ncbi:transcriptional regulator, LacI family [Seinonella peptonophila]|uniref:Transcriptional regulator, LacI family n=1 Tax=Seinonella peptonophila TaxID=112248 RepID=A0A1M5A648_9BACL|nr:LacI family DNA-binding transcriptional regulator [Seinonella peptonophila]SHF25624.1 transcriptional regulator, LacI family [Seinonella peptonophila]
MSTIRDVAALANVSIATVSRVINEKGYVDVNTKKKVMAAIRELQYVPNSVAQVLAGKKLKGIAVIMPDIQNPFFAELARAIEDMARQRGFTLFLCNSDDQSEKEKVYLDVLKSKSIDGIIFASNALAEEEIYELQRQGIPAVLMDRAFINEQRESSVSVIRTQNRQGVHQAIQHLRSVGCETIAHIYGPQHLITAKERYKSYIQEVESFSWFDQSLLEPGYFQIEGGRQAVRKLLLRHPEIDGIFAGNDMMAIGALKELRCMGISVPEQVAICGYDGIQLSQITEPELTTVVQPIYEMGRLAAQILIEKIGGISDHEIVYELEVKLVERGSTKRGRL